MTNPKAMSGELGRLPPYARKILNWRYQGLVPNNGVYISVNSWRHVHRNKEGVVVLPPGEPPERFDWTFATRLDVLMVVDERDLEIADRLALILVGLPTLGCAALIKGGPRDRVGWRLYRSYFDNPAEALHAA